MAISNRFQIIIAVCFLVQHSYSHSFTSKYDYYITKYSNQYLKPYVAVYGTEIFKAQLYQESLLNPNAVSPVGAAGLGQMMPGTWQDQIKRLGFPKNASAFDPKLNIHASAYYLSTLLGQWYANRPMSDRLSLGWASYNAGLGNIINAQKSCNMAVAYQDIIRCLPNVTGHHSKETKQYVERIWSYYFKMRFL